ncbi:MAG: DUF2934 domain-containing protein [Vicinamibacterales bacterium]
MQSDKAPDTFTAIAAGPPADRPGAKTRVTTNHTTIRQWAAAHGAEPATGQAIATGPAVRDVNDSGPGIRFNFPGFARFRPIGWDEWLDHFDQHQLAFVYEEEDREQVADRAHQLWRQRGSPLGDPDADWFEAERELRRLAGGVPVDGRYAIVTMTAARAPRGD